MKQKRLSIAILMVLLSTFTIFAAHNPSGLKYATFLPTFSIDKAWEFNSNFVSWEYNSGSSATSSKDNTTLVPFPGNIAWSINTWIDKSGSDDGEMTSAQISLVNGSTGAEMEIAYLQFAANDDKNDHKTPSSITNANGCTTVQTNYQMNNYDRHSLFNYFHTIYGDAVRDFIAAAGSNIKVKCRAHFDGNIANYYSNVLDEEDRQQIILPQPNVSDIAWTVNNNTTCVAFKPGVTAADGLKLKIEEYWNTNLNSEYQSFSSNSYCYYHPAQLTNYTNKLNIYTDYFKYKLYTENTYYFNTNKYLNNASNYQYPQPTTTTIRSTTTYFNAPAFAQPQNATTVDNKDGSVTLTWSNQDHTSGQAYDNSKFIIERATNSTFTENRVTQDVDLTYHTGTGSTSYTWTDNFNIRNQDTKTFYYRIHREHAENTELNSTTSIRVNTDYATLGNFEATVDSLTSNVNMRWDYNAGIKNSELKLRITYDITVIEKNSTDSVNRVNGIDNIASCVPTRITAQLYADNAEYGLPISVTVTVPSTEKGIIDTVMASAGYFNDKVNISWKINKTYHNFSDFQLVRMVYGDTLETPLTNVSFTGGIYNYTFTDNTCIPGVYYIYKLKGFSECNGTVSEASHKNAIGFAQPYGVVSGQISYSGNQSVENVAVVAQCEDQFSGKSLCLQAGYHPKLEIPSYFVSQMLRDTAGTIEFFVRLDNMDRYNPIMKCGDRLNLWYQDNKLKLSSGSNSAEVDSAFSIGIFRHIAISYNNDSVTLYVNGNAVATVASSRQALQSILFGSNQNNYMTGYLDEIRVWNTMRTQQKIQLYMDSYLNGSESGLTAYYRCDDDICIELFDISENTNNHNGRHIRISGVTFDEVNIPTIEQLGHKAYTNQYGNYLFNNIPYSESGTLYNVIPMFGVHEFSPAQRPLFFNSTAVTHNAVDFEDVSSFSVSGTVTFANTNYPVEGCMFYIDGTTLCTKEGMPVETDAEGKYTIDVPIGNHYITIKKDGHTFLNAGRYPASGTFDFQNEITNLTFKDKTLVLLTGRVAGGSDEADKPHGFGYGKATIGKAKIILTPTNDNYNLNTNEQNGRTFVRPDYRLNGQCRSVATTGRAYQDLARSVTIMTDSITGEFNVLLPPIDFVVSNVEIDNNRNITSEDFSPIAIVTLGSQNIQLTNTDSVAMDSATYRYFDYSYALDLIHYTQPTLSVIQNLEDSAMGSRNYIYNDEVTGFTDTIPLYTINADGSIEYHFGYPCFKTDSAWSWTISAYETYVNYNNPQNPDTTRQPFRYGLVTVSNNIGEQLKNTNALMDTTIAISNSDVVYASGNELLLDSTGTTYYSFKVGEPNILPPYTSNISITYQDKSRTRYYEWAKNDNAKFIVFGSKMTGTNFVTKGPDEVFFILRDPVGSGSYAEWESGNVITKTKIETSELVRNESIDNYVLIRQDVELVSAPFGVGITSANVQLSNKVGPAESLDGSTEWTNSKTWRFTNQTTVSTNNSPYKVGSDADVFIGNGTNRLFGDAMQVYVKRDTAGNYSIDNRKQLSVTSEFTTQFNYSQFYVEYTLIPNLKELRNELITQVSTSQYDSSYLNPTDSVIYITTVSREDERFGENGTYLAIWPSNPQDTTHVYVDMVYDYNNQIRRWVDVLTHNEHCKVMVHNSNKPFDRTQWENVIYDNSNYPFNAIKGPSIDSSYNKLDLLTANYNGGWLVNNYSIGGGANLSVSETKNYATVSNGIKESDGFKIGMKGQNSGTIVGVGVEFEWEAMIGGNFTSENSTLNGNSSTVTYHVNINPQEAMTFDVYQAPDGFGPIFATRAGQTLCPYQDQEVTKYYQPGTVIQEATVPMSEPRITVQNPIVTNVPVGNKAYFNIELANTATPFGLTSCLLKQVSSSNPDGAVLTLDGSFVNDYGVPFTMSNSSSFNKTLVLEQARPDVLDYDSIGIVLQADCYLFNADTIWISAHFIQTCSEIALRADRTTLNNTTGNSVNFTIDGFDQNFRNINGIQLQYKSEGANQWSILHQFPADSAAVIHYNHTFIKPQYPDGTYKFRAVTSCQYGNEIVNNESDELTVTVDMAAPEALGQPYPLDGIYTTNNQIYVDFNEAIQPGRIISDNVTVEGVLNAHQVDHSIALNLENNTAISNAAFQLGTTPFTLEIWLKYTEPGTIFSYAGGGASGIEFAVDANNKFVATVNGEQHISDSTLPTGTWMFFVIKYNVTDSTHSILDATCSYETKNVTLLSEQGFAKKSVASGNIRFGGNGLNAKIHDAAIWKTIRTTAEALAQRSESKSIYTPNIYSLWRMDEGRGTVARDDIRQRHLTLAHDDWAYNHVNYAMHVAAGDSAIIDISEHPITKDDSYLLEMWFRTNGNAEIFHLNGGMFPVGINNGNLIINGLTVPIIGYQNNEWHHLAIIKPTISTPVVAIDGEQLPTYMLTTLPITSAGHITFGNANNTSNIDIDEVRLWNINTTLNATKLLRSTCLNGDEPGLVAYYPMEKYVTDAVTSQTSTLFSLEDKMDTSAIKRTITHYPDTANVQSNSAPALVESRPTEYVAHTHTASENRIMVNVTEAAARIEGCHLEITVKDIIDANGNYSEPIRWSVFVNRNQLLWNNDSYTIVKDEVEDTTINLTIVNNSSVVQNWSIKKVPACMTLSNTTGYLQPLQSTTIQCTIDATADRGETEHILYLSGNENMSCPLYITTKVYANKPNWNIDPTEFEYSMSIIGYVEVNGTIADDEEDMMAAFVDGNLSGVANLRLLPAMGRYFIMMTLYQNDETTSVSKDITFRYWDASTGIVYSDAQLYSTTNGMMQSIDNLKYHNNTVMGSFIEPLRIVMGDDIEQVLELEKGWNWVSFNVEPSSKSFNSIMSAYINDFSIIKNQDGYAQPDRSSGTVNGSIGDMDCKDGYKIKTKTTFDINLTGFAASLDSVITLKATQWTWFGFLPQKAMTTNAAMSNINPAVGDIVKSKSQFASWDGYQWIGSLDVMRPGQGYVYYSYSDNNIIFTYPDFASMANLLPAQHDEALNYFEPVDPGMYQGNMNITAVVKRNGEEVNSAEIGIFAGSECRAAATYHQGYYFITVPGDSAVQLAVKVVYNDSIYTLQGNLTYRNDAIIGSFAAPFTIELTSGMMPDIPTNDDGEPLTVVSVEAVKDAKVEKVLIDNEVFIIKDGKMYDILGRPRK